MGTLLFDSFHIRNFRLFHDLHIEQLQRVNLLVGRNNRGKTCLLEALQLYAARGHPRTMLDHIQTRNEDRYPPDVPGAETVRYKHLFYQRQDYTNAPSPIQIGPIPQHDGADNAQDDTLTIAWSQFTSQQRILDNGASYLVTVPISSDQFAEASIVYAGLIVRFHQQERYITSFGDTSSLRWFAEPDIPCLFVPASGLDMNNATRWWGRIAASDVENRVLDALRIIEPTTDVLRFIQLRDNDGEVVHIPIVRLRGNSEPVPLHSMGESMYRMLGIVLALLNAKDGLLLVDEIESGLHYSVQYEMWQLIFALARQQHVQVFATTHSDDCVQSFAEAMHDEEQEDGLLIRLGRSKDNIVATVFNEDELETIVEQQVEVR